MHQRLSQAHRDINVEFGTGFDYARSNPQLVAAYLQVEAIHEMREALTAAARPLIQAFKAKS